MGQYGDDDGTADDNLTLETKGSTRDERMKAQDESEDVGKRPLHRTGGPEDDTLDRQNGHKSDRRNRIGDGKLHIQIRVAHDAAGIARHMDQPRAQKDAASQPCRQDHDRADQMKLYTHGDPGHLVKVGSRVRGARAYCNAVRTWASQPIRTALPRPSAR